MLRCFQIAVIMALGFLVGCSRSPQPAVVAVPVAATAFSTVLERLEQEAERGSQGTTKIKVGPLSQDPDGSHLVMAKRETPSATTGYQLRFQRLPDRWVCIEATADEVDMAGAKTMNRLSSKSTEIDQLLRWLAWVPAAQ